MTKTVATYYGCQIVGPDTQPTSVFKPPYTLQYVTGSVPYTGDVTYPNNTTPINPPWLVVSSRSKTEIAAEVIKDLGELATLLQNKEATNKKLKRLLKRFVAVLADIVTD